MTQSPSYSAVIVGLACGIGLIGVLSYLISVPTSTKLVVKDVPVRIPSSELCGTTTDAMLQTELKIRTPSYMQEGYNLKCAFGDRYAYSLVYWNQSTISFFDWQYGLPKGAIVISVGLDPAPDEHRNYTINATANAYSLVEQLNQYNLPSRIAIIQNHQHLCENLTGLLSLL